MNNKIIITDREMGLRFNKKEDKNDCMGEVFQEQFKKIGYRLSTSSAAQPYQKILFFIIS
jgi:hypothetical protein